ncbi:hypothetical protein L1887_35400 [Cichorium endivia]|nr:hypothetical protein L1887_35400 [Cichorium endivia]
MTLIVDSSTYFLFTKSTTRFTSNISVSLSFLFWRLYRSSDITGVSSESRNSLQHHLPSSRRLRRSSVLEGGVRVEGGRVG